MKKFLPVKFKSGNSSLSIGGYSHLQMRFALILQIDIVGPSGPTPIGNHFLKILLIDDHPLIAQAISSLLSGRAGIEFLHAATAADGEALFIGNAIDVALIDLNLPDANGLDLVKRFREGNPDARLIVLTFEEDAAMAAKAFNAGAMGFIGKSSSPELVIEAIDTVCDGRSWLAPQMMQEVALLRVSGFPLSERERLILNRLAYGANLTQLAFELGVSYNTISKDCTNLRERLGAQSLPELVRIGMSKKLID